MSSVAVPISRVTPRSDASQSGSLVVGYELVVGCDNPMDRGADLRETYEAPKLHLGLLPVDSLEQKAIGSRGYSVCVPGWLVELGGGWGLVTIILAVLCTSFQV